MKILCIADQIDPLVYSNSIRERFTSIDLVISAGDLRQNYYDFIVSNLNKPLYFLFGNHRLEGIEYYTKKYRTDIRLPFSVDQNVPSSGAIYLDNHAILIKGLLIAGLDGSIWYNGGKNQYTERQMVFKAIRLVPKLLWNRIRHGRFLDILVTHSPPFGFYCNKDKCHTGFKVFLLFMKVFKPKYLIHGHIHLWDRNEKRIWLYETTTVINAFNHCIINV